MRLPLRRSYEIVGSEQGVLMLSLGRFAFAMLLLVALSVGSSAPAPAQSTGIYRSELNQLTLDMRAMWGELERFQVKRRYCLPPDEPSKAQDQAALDALESRADAINARYQKTKQGLQDFLRTNTKIAGDLMNNGVDPSDHRWWTRYETSRKMMNDELARKKAALAAAPEVNCSPKPKAKPAVAAAPPPPPLPVRPGIAPQTWPPLPPHFCSWDEYWKFIIERINPLYEQAAKDAETAAQFRTQVEVQVNNLVQADKPIPPALAALRRQAIADVAKYDRLSAEAADMRRRAGAIPVIDCRQPTRQPDSARQDLRTGQAPTTAPTLPQWARGHDQGAGDLIGKQQRIIDAVEADFKQFEAFVGRRPSCTALWDEADDFDIGLDELEEDDLVPPSMIRQWRSRLDRLVDDCAPPRIQLRDMLQKPVTGLPPPTDRAAIQILSIHNSERALYRLPALQWDPQLAAGALGYAQQLARTGVRVHAPREGRGAVRENLNQGMLGWSPTQMMQNWLRERQDFVPGTYPDVTRTGRWQDVSHYTQMIWPTTTQVGCGLASGSGYQWLVCRYSPGGNKDGMAVGLTAPIANQGDVAPPNSSTPALPFDPRSLPREKIGGGMTQIDPPPPPPPTARDDPPDGKEENHPLVRYAQAADAQHATETDCGNAAMARLELEKMRYALDELKKRLKAARQAGPFSNIKPADVQRQIDELERRIREAEQRQPRPRGVCPPPPPPA